MKSIKSGRLDASVARPPYLVGKQALEKAKMVLAGKKVDQAMYVPTIVLTRQVIAENKDPKLKYVK